MALSISKDEENIWLVDKEICDIVICVIEKFDVGPPTKKRVCAMSAGDDSDAKCDAAAAKGVWHQGPMIKLHTASKLLGRSSYFVTHLKEPWCKQEEKEESLLELPLETHAASSQGYQRCIDILCSLDPCSAHMFSSPLEALDTYLASDHLLFEECKAACMNYLSSAEWSNEERKIISETFLTWGIKPSEDVAARLGLSTEKTAQCLSQTLWYLYKESHIYVDEMEYGLEPEEHPGGVERLSRFQHLIRDLLEGDAMKDPDKSSKKIIIEFLYRATDDCIQKLKNNRRGTRTARWLVDEHFDGWVHMMQLVMDFTDGKKVVEALACDIDIHDLFIPTFNNILEEYVHYERSDQYHYRMQYFDDIDPLENLHFLAYLVLKAVKLLRDGFKRVAEMQVIVPESTRSSLITRWLPLLDTFYKSEKFRELVDLPSLKGHIHKILQTLSMEDESFLISLANGAMNKGYFLEGAFKAWCERFD